MLVSGRDLRSSLRRVIGTGVAAGALLAGTAGLASADPVDVAPPPNCTAADLAVASGTVGTAMGDYLFTHPWVNDFFTGLRGLPNEQIRGEVQTYMDANPQTEAEINAIRQPVTDLRARCDVTAEPAAAEGAVAETPVAEDTIVVEPAVAEDAVVVEPAVAEGTVVEPAEDGGE